MELEKLILEENNTREQKERGMELEMLKLEESNRREQRERQMK